MEKSARKTKEGPQKPWDRAVAKKRGAYAAMIGKVIAGWFREQSETRDIFSRDHAIPGSFLPGIRLRISRRRKEKGRLRRDDLFYGDETQGRVSPTLVGRST